MKRITSLLIASLLITSTSACAKKGTNGENSEVPRYTEGELSSLVDHFVGLGAPERATELAIEYYQAYQDQFDNQRYLTVIDMGLHSSEKRFFVLDMANKTLKGYAVSHGKNSDPDHDGYATSFSNVNQSKKTSLGFYQVSETYYGSHGYSVKMDGLSSTNSNARSRYIVIHGADYVKYGNAKQGRSWGCPALDKSLSTGVINKLKNGSLLFLYAPAWDM